MRIRPVVESLCRKYDTRNPFEIAALRKIVLLHEPLGDVRGYYNRVYRQQFIHLNDRLEKNQALFTAAHELGHALLHPEANTPFLRAHTLYSINKLEVQANHFAVTLLFSDDDLAELTCCSTEQVSLALGITPELAQYRMKNFQIKLR